jgi:DNA-binding NarL/FixJ family response regulator
MIKICIVDPHEISRYGLALLLDQQEDFQVIDMFPCVASLLQQLPTLECDILLATVFLDGRDSTVLLQEVNRIKPFQKTIFFTLKGRRTYAQWFSSLKQPVFCIEEPLEKLLKLIRALHCNLTIPQKTTDFIQNKGIDPVTIYENCPNRVLTKREIELLRLIYLQHSSKSIAQQLFLSASTIETHRKNILYKLGAHNTVGLIKYVIKNGLFADEDQMHNAFSDSS